MTANTFERIAVTRRGPVGVVTLDRPERRNALDSATIEELPRAVTELSRLADVRAIVLTGAGSAFCSGLDLDELATSGGNLGLPDRREYPWPWQSEVPVIGAVNGPAIAGGFELALHCDFLIGGPTALFGDTHARVGQFPGAGLTVRLVEAIGVGRAKMLCLTGNFIDAATALAWGILAEVVDDPIERAVELGGDVADNDARTVDRLLPHLDQVAAFLIEPGLRLVALEMESWNEGFTTDDVKARKQGIFDRSRRMRSSF